MRSIDSIYLGSGNIYNILLAEDDEDDFYIFNQAMTAVLGQIQILQTSNGVMLSSMIQTKIHPDVIFLDINMPYKNGITCLKEIRSNHAFDETRVVMYSASCQQRDIDLSYAMGANFYLVKPSDFSQTTKQLSALFQDENFKLNVQPPLCKGFVMDYQKASNKKLQSKLVA